MAKPTKSPKTEPAKPTLLDRLHKEFGSGAINTLAGGQRSGVPVVPTGSMGLDRALGVGGLPLGRVVEIYGPESAGKTTLMLHVLANAQAQGLKCAFVDAEHALDPTYAEALGVDLDTLLVSQPDYGEQALNLTRRLVESGEVGVVVVDSVAALTPKAELDGEIGTSLPGLQARMMGQAMRLIVAAASRTGTLVVFINQLRSKIGVMFGSPETTPGGNALKFYASVRLDIRRIGKVKQGDQVTASRTRVKVVKNKCAPPFQEAEFDIAFGMGVDRASEVLDECLAYGHLDRYGSHIWLGGKPDGRRLGGSRAETLDVLRAEPDLLASLVETCLARGAK